jgi:hypothetical protein
MVFHGQKCLADVVAAAKSDNEGMAGLRRCRTSFHHGQLLNDRFQALQPWHAKYKMK